MRTPLSLLCSALLSRPDLLHLGLESLRASQSHLAVDFDLSWTSQNTYTAMWPLGFLYSMGWPQTSILGKSHAEAYCLF